MISHDLHEVFFTFPPEPTDRVRGGGGGGWRKKEKEKKRRKDESGMVRVSRNSRVWGRLVASETGVKGVCVRDLFYLFFTFPLVTLAVWFIWLLGGGCGADSSPT